MDIIILVFLFTFLAEIINSQNCPNVVYYDVNKCSGQFQSPNFPGLYPNNAHCIFNITVPPGYLISVMVLQFELEACCDRLILFDGPYDKKNPIMILSDTVAPLTTFSTMESNTMTLEFATDANTNYEIGFNFNFTAFNASDVGITPETTVKTTSTTKQPPTTETTFFTNSTPSITTMESTSFSKTSTLVASSSTSPFSTATSFSIWWIVTGIGVLIIFILILLIIWLIRRRKLKEQHMQYQNEILQKAKNKVIETQIPKKDRQWKMFLESKNVVIDFDNVLGKGSNATVYKAFQKNTLNFPVMRQTFKSKHFLNSNIAAKVPTQFHSNEAEEFIREINSLIFLKSHDHIISFLGWTMFGQIPVLITELADTTLLSYVQSISTHENFLKPCLQYLWQITYALEYIAEKNMIHRDVACRNILLKGKNVAKLADFGLCCFADPKTGTFKDSFNKKFPIKWLSLEALNECVFSEKSDVWAFGILCFEVFSHGSIPYSTMLNSEMIEFLQNGKRLEKPINAPDYVYELMLNCWREKPQDRPTFQEICKGIRIMLENETMKYGYLSLDKAFDEV